MYFANYIQSVIYIISTYFLVVLIASIPQSTKLRKIYFNARYCFLFVLSGIALGNIMGSIYEKDTEKIITDNIRFFSFTLIFLVPIYVIRLPQKYGGSLEQKYRYFSYTYTLLVFASLLLSTNKFESIYPGNLFGASTFNLTIISSWSFYALINYIRYKRNLDLIFCIIYWLVSIISLAKWNFFVMVSIPIFLFHNTILLKNKIAASTKLFLIGFVCISLVFITLFNEVILNKVANLDGYENFESYLNSRVFRDSENTDNIDRGLIKVGNGQGVKDGGRGLMWEDLLDRTYKSPIVGIGFGARALEDIGYEMEDHNIFLQFASRFGFPLSIISFIFIYKYFKSLFTLFKYNYPNNKNIIILAFLNFFFQSSVGNIWGQCFVTLLIGAAWGLMLRPPNAKLSIT
jgi:hypothetical protein